MAAHQQVAGVRMVEIADTLQLCATLITISNSASSPAAVRHYAQKNTNAHNLFHGTAGIP